MVRGPVFELINRETDSPVRYAILEILRPLLAAIYDVTVIKIRCYIVWFRPALIYSGTPQLDDELSHS